MATSPTSKSALLSGAAKDDVVGLNGDFTFSIFDLLGNDPGGAAKVDLAKQFLFGTTEEDWADQAGYLANHGIIDNGDNTYTITSDGEAFQYMVQIGNKGTWSTADVDVTAPEPVVEPEPHAGDLLFEETFDDYDAIVDYGTWQTVDLTKGPSTSPAAGHSWAVKDANGNWVGVTGEVVEGVDGNIQPTSGDHWLDTQNSPGGIDISNWFTDPTGGQFVLSFDLGIHDFGDTRMTETDHDAKLQVLVDGNLVDELSYAEVFAQAESQNAGQGVETMGHFEYVIAGGAPGDHSISFVDTTASEGNYVGFALDTIQVHDWLI